MLLSNTRGGSLALESGETQKMTKKIKKLEKNEKLLICDIKNSKTIPWPKRLCSNLFLNTEGDFLI